MPFRAAHEVAVGVGLEGERTERNPLVELHVAADFARLADHDAGAVVDEEVVADRGARMDVDAGARVGPLGHHARDERHLEPVQEVGQPVDGHRLQARVAEDHLVERAHGRVAVVGRLHVRGQHPAQFRDAFQELHRLGLPQRLEVALLAALRHGVWHGRGLDTLRRGGPLGREAVPQGAADLRGELVVQPVHEVAHVVGDVAEVQVFTAPIPGVEDLLEILAGRDDRLVVGQRAVSEVVDRGHVLIRVDDPPRQFGQLLLDAHVCGHGDRW